jgi:hypothetical protein
MEKAIPYMRDAIISLAANMGLGIGEFALGWDAIKVVTHGAQLYVYYKENDLKNMGYETGEIVFDLVEALNGKGSITVDGYTVAFAEEAIKANKAILTRKL